MANSSGSKRQKGEGQGNNPTPVARLLLKYLLTDFRERDLGADALRWGYEGFSLPELKRTCTEHHGVSAVNFELAVNELEEAEFITTGPMAVYDNPPGSSVVILATYSKREHASLTEKGYRVIDGEDFLFPDRVAVHTSADGQWHPDIKAQVERDKITLLEGALPVTEGDCLRRELPNGITEEFTIQHLEFHAADMDFPAMMVAHVRKRGSALHDRQHRGEQSNYTVTGANARVNVNSIDNSVNTVTVNTENVFPQLTQAITQQVHDVKLREKLALAVQDMERTRGTRDFTLKFQTFMAVAADCMTVVMPFVPALTAMLK